MSSNTNLKGQDCVAARHLVAYDLASDGDVVYSNGFEVFRPVGGWQAVTRANFIEIVCGPA